MKSSRRLATVFLLALMVAGLGFEARAQDPCRRPGTPLEAKALAKKAVDNMAEVGAERAFADFMSPQGDFLPWTCTSLSLIAGAGFGSTAAFQA